MNHIRNAARVKMNRSGRVPSQTPIPVQVREKALMPETDEELGIYSLYHILTLHADILSRKKLSDS